MAEIVGSALVHETVSQVLSNLVQKYEDKEESSANRRNLERLEMAHIRLEAALETSEKWQITDASLLRWRRKLKRAALECDDTLHRCKQRILEATNHRYVWMAAVLMSDTPRYSDTSRYTYRINLI